MSRRFKNRHAKVQADPSAEPAAPVVLDDSNSTVDPLQPDRRIPKVLNGRFLARAECLVAADRDAAIARAREQLAEGDGEDGDGQTG
jgi:hypothetical protein